MPVAPQKRLKTALRMSPNISNAARAKGTVAAARGASRGLGEINK